MILHHIIIYVIISISVPVCEYHVILYYIILYQITIVCYIIHFGPCLWICRRHCRCARRGSRPRRKSLGKGACGPLPQVRCAGARGESLKSQVKAHLHSTVPFQSSMLQGLNMFAWLWLCKLMLVNACIYIYIYIYLVDSLHLTHYEFKHALCRTDMWWPRWCSRYYVYANGIPTRICTRALFVWQLTLPTVAYMWCCSTRLNEGLMLFNSLTEDLKDGPVTLALFLIFVFMLCYHSFIRCVIIVWK